MGNTESGDSHHQGAFLDTLIDAENYIHPLSPCQQIFKAKDWTFDSAFECGNLEKIKQVGPNSFEFWPAPDNWKTNQQEKDHGFWYYFSLTPSTPLKEGEHKKVTLIWKDQRKTQLRGVLQGLVPVYRSLPDSPNWKYIPTRTKSVDRRTYTFDTTFEFDFTSKDEKVFFAYSFPYSYSDTIKHIDGITKKFKDDNDIFCHRELLTLSAERRRIDLVTITSRDPNLDLSTLPKEPVLDHLFPLLKPEYKDVLASKNIPESLTHRPPVFEHKQYIFLTSRIHSGEAPGSYMFEGFLNGLLNKSDPVSKALLDKYVFVIIPILNPDGVAKGHSRGDTKKGDPNRRYGTPTPEDPAQYAVIELAKQFGKTKNLWMFMDFHAHCNKEAAFVFGTTGKNKEANLETKALIRTFDVWSDHFNYEECGWNACDFDKPNGVSKNAVVYYSHCPHSYTIEASYHRGTKDAEKYKKFSVEDLRIRAQLRYQRMGIDTGKPDIPTDSVDMNYYMPKINYKLLQEHFIEVGDNLRNAIIDYQGNHPNSKLKDTCFKNREGVLDYVKKTPIVDKNKKKEGKEKSDPKKKSDKDDDSEESGEYSMDEDVLQKVHHHAPKANKEEAKVNIDL